MSSEDKEGKQRNEEIDNQLKRDKMNLRSEIKMLLLGEASVLLRLSLVDDVSCSESLAAGRRR